MRRFATLGAAAVFALAGCGGSSKKSGSVGAHERAPSAQREAAQRHAAAVRATHARARKRAAVDPLRRRQAQTQQSTGGAAVPSQPAPSTGAPGASSGGAAPSVDSPQGKRQLKTDPDCAGHPAPPPGYHGPVQC